MDSSSVGGIPILALEVRFSISSIVPTDVQAPAALAANTMQPDEPLVMAVQDWWSKTVEAESASGDCMKQYIKRKLIHQLQGEIFDRMTTCYNTAANQQNPCNLMVQILSDTDAEKNMTKVRC